MQTCCSKSSKCISPVSAAAWTSCLFTEPETFLLFGSTWNWKLLKVTWNVTKLLIWHKCDAEPEVKLYLSYIRPHCPTVTMIRIRCFLFQWHSRSSWSKQIFHHLKMMLARVCYVSCESAASATQILRRTVQTLLWVLSVETRGTPQRPLIGWKSFETCLRFVPGPASVQKSGLSWYHLTITHRN